MTSRVWMIILSGGIILGIALGFRQSLGLFLPHLSTDLGIGRESFALGMGLLNLFWGIGAPFTGALADRYGSFYIIIISALLYAAGLAVMTMSGQGEQLLTSGILMGLGLSGVGFSVILGVVGRNAPEDKRGMALGVASMGGSIGQFLALPYVHILIENYNWSMTLLILAACSLIMVPLAYSFAEKQTAQQQNISDQTMKEAFYEASNTKDFWLLNLGFFVCGFQVVFVAVHFPAYLSDLGFLPWVGVAALTIIGIGNIIGNFFCGVLGDIYPRKYLLSALYMMRSIIIALFLLFPASQTSVLIFSAGIGLLWLGTVPLTSGLVAKLYGTKYMSMLFGIVFFSHQFGSFLGAWLAGRLYDSVGNYNAMWMICIALGIMASLVHWPISERPVPRLATMKGAE